MNIVAAIPLFVLTGLVVGFPAAMADHPTAIVENAPGSSVVGCEATNECFIPHTVTIDAGGEVTWTNNDNAAHTTTSGTPQDGPDGFFDSSLVLPGNDFTVKFDDVGEYQYFCLVHPWMSGMVIVQEAMADGDSMMDDDSMMMEDDSMMDDGMMMTAQDASVMGMLSDGTNVMIMATEVMAGEPVRIDIVFEDSEHVNYDIMVMQGDAVVLDETDAHEHQGMGQHMTDMLPTDDPIDITIIFQGYGVDQITGPVNEELVFTHVVPEFGTIAALVLAAAIVSIVVVTARSRLSIVPRL